MCTPRLLATHGLYLIPGTATSAHGSCKPRVVRPRRPASHFFPHTRPPDSKTYFIAVSKLCGLPALTLSLFSPKTALEKNFARRRYGTLFSLCSLSTISACRLFCLLANLTASRPGMARQDLFFFSLFFFRSPPASYMEGMYMEGTSLTTPPSLPDVCIL